MVLEVKSLHLKVLLLEGGKFGLPKEGVLGYLAKFQKAVSHVKVKVISRLLGVSR